MSQRNSSSNGQLAALSAGLRAAKRRVYLQRFGRGLSCGIEWATRWLLAGSLAALVVAAIQIVAPFGTQTRGILLAAAVVALAAILSALAGAALRKPRDPEAAERLDAALANHNRIATAYDLLQHQVASPMAQAAIADGLEALSRSNRSPLLDDVSWPWRRAAGRLVLAAAIAIGAIFLPRIKFKAKALDPTIAQIAMVPAVSTNDTAPSEPSPRPPAPANRPTNDPTSSAGNNAAVTPAAAPAAAALAAASSGTSGGANAGKTGGGEPSGGAESKKQNNPPAPGTKQDQSKPSLGSGMGGGVQGASTGSVGAGGKGAGGKSLSVENETRRQDASDIDANDDAGGDSVEPDENNGNRHRGGAQPLLQDRRPSPVRELGMSGVKGPPGNGRGGPTPTKKARGAGSLLLGVPVPDFVPGQLLAGLSKISRENIKPRRADLPGPAPAAVSDRATDEGLIERFDVPPEDSQAVLRYFNELHREEASPQAATSTDLAPKEGASTN